MKTHNDDLDIRIAKVLRVGVVIAGALIFVGWLSQISVGDLATRSDMVFDQFRIYESRPLFGVLEALLQEGRWGVLLSYLGLAVLIALPAIRVFMTFVSFVIYRDLVLSVLSAIVFLSLMVSFSLGL